MAARVAAIHAVRGHVPTAVAAVVQALTEPVRARRHRTARSATVEWGETVPPVRQLGLPRPILSRTDPSATPLQPQDAGKYGESNALQEAV